MAGRDVEAVAVETERLEAGGEVVRLEPGEGHSRYWLILKKSRRCASQNKPVQPFEWCRLTLRLESAADGSVVGVKGRRPAHQSAMLRGRVRRKVICSNTSCTKGLLVSRPLTAQTPSSEDEGGEGTDVVRTGTRRGTRSARPKPA